MFDAQADGGLEESFRLEALNRCQDRLDALPQVDRAFCMADIVEEMNWAFHGERDEYRVIPEDSLLIRQYLFI